MCMLTLPGTYITTGNPQDFIDKEDTWSRGTAARPSWAGYKLTGTAEAVPVYLTPITQGTW